MPDKSNPGPYFEIPVTDMHRATTFYKHVFGFDFEMVDIHDNQMALMPFEAGGTGISGALAKGDIYKPSVCGTLIYLRTENIEQALERAQQAGAKVLFPKTNVNDYALVAEIEDCEGNRIGLMQHL